MHGAERADEHTEADALPEPEKRDHDAEVENRFGKEQETVQHDPISLQKSQLAGDSQSSTFGAEWLTGAFAGSCSKPKAATVR